jgi:hypothetical protein
MRRLLHHLSSVAVQPPRSGSGAASVINVAYSACAELSKPSTLSFHGVWLRDNCLCPTCFDSQTKQRQVPREPSLDLVFNFIATYLLFGRVFALGEHN